MIDPDTSDVFQKKVDKTLDRNHDQQQNTGKIEAFGFQKIIVTDFC